MDQLDKDAVSNHIMEDDARFLKWIHDRLVNVHGENPNYDYMWRLRGVIVNMVCGENIKGV